MTISMHSASVPIFTRQLRNMLGWLDKAEAHAKQRGFDPDNYLGLRLAPDMFPFSRQIQVASDACKGCLVRLSGSEGPTWPDDEASLDELRARIAKTIEFAESVPADQIDGTEERTITLEAPGASFEFTGEAFLKTFSLPNFFFHCTMTYALLRHAGVELGKMDYLGAP
jgi:hypothetical protein